MSEQETVVLDIHTEAKPRRVRDVAARMLALSRNDVPDKTEADALLVRLVEILAVYMEHAGNRTSNIYLVLEKYRAIQAKHRDMVE